MFITRRRVFLTVPTLNFTKLPYDITLPPLFTEIISDNLTPLTSLIVCKLLVGISTRKNSESPMLRMTFSPAPKPTLLK